MPCPAGAARVGLEGVLHVAGGVAAIAAVLVLAIAWHAAGHRRVARALARQSQPGLLLGYEVALVDGLTAPAVAGLLRPRIYCPADLVDRLNERELSAVLLHERSHQAARDPARLVFLSAVATVLPRWDRVRCVIERRIAGFEIAADRNALHAGAQRADLAGALLKLQAPLADATLASYASASELRVRHLLGELQPPPKRQSILLLVAVPIATFVICFVLPVAL